MAAVASWTSERRPVASRSVLDTVTLPSTVTMPEPRWSAAAIVTTGGSDAPGRGVAPGAGVAPGTGVEPGAGAGAREQSAASRSQRR